VSKFARESPGQIQRFVTPTVHEMQLYTVDTSPVTIARFTSRLGK
jgi:hypothetical protein